MDLDLAKDNNYQEGLKQLFDLQLLTTTPIIIVTYDDRWDTYKAALNTGAAGYLFKKRYPLNVLIWQRYIENTINLSSFRHDPISYFSHSAPEQYQQIRQTFAGLRHYKVPIVLQGEPGTGKGIIVQKIWKEEFYPDKEVAIINLGKQRNKTLEEVLSLHSTEKIIFFTDYENMNISQQDELLAMFQKKIFEQYPRWIFSCTTPLMKLKEEDKILPSLYQYLSFFTFSLQPLRAKKTELKQWIDHFLKDPTVCPVGSYFFGLNSDDVFDLEAIEALKNYDWPENVRGLRSVIQVALATAEGESKPEDNNKPIVNKNCLPGRILNSARGFDLVPQWAPEKQTAYDELKNIQRALNESSHKGEEVAKQLGLKGELERFKKLKRIYNTYPDLFDNSLCNRLGFEHGYEMPIHLFICAAPQNDFYLSELKKHLNIIINTHPILVNDNVTVLAGDVTAEVVIRNLEEAHLVLLLMCADFFSDEELKELNLINMALRRDSTLRVIPIYTKPVDWKSHPGLRMLSNLPKNGKPISLWDSPDDAFLEVVVGIKQVLDSLKNRD
ncbi:MAG: hypothetical protein R2828_09420 [Saprospiraceae bacterium]